MRRFLNEQTGVYYAWPTSKGDAINAGIHLYYSTDHCPTCETYGDYPLRYVEDDTCVHCLVAGYNDEMGEIDWEKHTLRPTPCKGGPHLVKFHIGTKKCATCTDRKTPRQAAIAAGETWYMQRVPCSKCGTRALKRVHDGRCQGCEPLSDRQENTLPVDTVIDRKTAKSLGFIHYRTGKKCKGGHTGFRFVSTGHCVQCHRL